jgi:hypothetical protein
MNAPAFQGPLLLNLGIDIAFGAAVGLVVGLLRVVWRRFPEAAAEVADAALSRDVLAASLVSAICVLLHVVLGTASGLAAGALGLPGPAQLAFDLPSGAALHGAPAIDLLVRFGGLGGSGGPPDTPFSIPWLAILLVLLGFALIASLGIGVIAGSIASGMAAGAAKGAGRGTGEAIADRLSGGRSRRKSTGPSAPSWVRLSSQGWHLA